MFVKINIMVNSSQVYSIYWMAVLSDLIDFHAKYQISLRKITTELDIQYFIPDWDWKYSKQALKTPK